MHPCTLPRPLTRATLLLATALLMSACGGSGSDTASTNGTTTASTATALAAPASPTLADKVAVGEKLFDEVRLSAGGNLACVSCHEPSRGHADPEGVFLPLGGPRLDQQGLRSTPSVGYLNDNGIFRIDRQGRAMGGFTWDGRAADRAAQALGPLLAANEMANSNSAEVVTRVRALPYFGELLAAYSLATDASDAQVLQALQQALADYQLGDPDYQPYTSKFDAVLDGRATLTAQEERGRDLFSSPQRGNCASCHSITPPPGATKPLFTNFEFHALGVPRNTSAATADPNFFDLGLCGPVRTDLANRTDLCGLFKVPTLRNVALTAPYFHNGAVTTLEDAVAFYATRDTEPGRWYPTVGGVVQKFNDLPAAYRGNVNQQAPFGQLPGQAPRLSPQQVQDVVAFLRTLTDGFVR
jgi:cytochrome c peroxidase